MQRTCRKRETTQSAESNEYGRKWNQRPIYIQ